MPSQTSLRWIHTVNVNFVAVTYGLSIAVYGATLVDVAEVYGESIKSTSITLTARGLGSILSSIIGAAVFKYVNLQIVMIGCTIFGALSALLTAVLPTLMYLHVLTFFVGCTATLMEIGLHVWLQVLWKERSGSHFHFMNFMFGFGGIVGPFICEPFLLKESSSSIDIRKDGSTEFSAHIALGNISQVVNNEIPPERSESHIFTAFCIIAAIHGISALSIIVTYCMDSSDFKTGKDSSYFTGKLPTIHRRTILILLALYLTVGVTCELGFSAMVFAFAVNHPSLEFTKSQAAFLTSFFWAMFTVGRVLSTVLSMKLSPVQLFVGCHFIYVNSVLFMMLFIGTSPMWVIWLGTALLAIGLSPYWSNATAWSVQYIQLTPGSMSLIMVLISSGVMVIPFILGNQIAENPQIFLYANTGLALLLTLLALVLILYGNTTALKKHKAENGSVKKDGQ